MAFHLLQHDRPGALKLASALQQAVEQVGHCKVCNTLTEDEVCAICRDARRDRSRRTRACISC
jgi:recombination protein RecR